MIIMFGMGLSLEKKDFTNVFIYPKAIITGLIAQMIILPLVAFILMEFSNMSPIIKVGFILIAACPGGSASNLVAHLLKGNVALCISLTAINSLLILITLPLIVKLGLLLFVGEAHEIELPVLETIIKIFITTILPTITGMSLRRKNPNFADRMEQPLKVIMLVLLFSVFAAIILFEENRIEAGIASYKYILPWALALNFTAMVAGFLFARMFNCDHKNNFTISIQVGMQNSALAIFIAANLLQNREMAMVAVIYSSFTFFSTTLFGFLEKRYGKI
jgi:BASS family bile acid:Na+ symporter